MTLLVGHRHGQPVTVANGEHVLLIGPPASGKTSGFLVPSVLGHDGPVLVTSSKADVAQLTVARSQLGRRLSFTIGSAPVPDTIPVVWNPLEGCASYDEAMLRADAMVQTVKILQDASGDDALWYTLASRALSALMFAGARARFGLDGMGQILRWVTSGDLSPALQHLKPGTPPHAIVDGLQDADEPMRGSVLITLVQCLRVFDSPSLNKTAGAVSFSPQEFVAGRDTLYVVAPLERQEFFAALVVGLVDAVARAAMLRAPAEEHLARENRSAVVLALDEVANIAPLHQLPRLVSAGGGQGLQVMAVLQDLSQARSRWKAYADGFLTLFQHKVVLPGVMHADTLEALSKCLPHLSANGTPIAEYPAHRIASLRRHRPGEPGAALWIDGATPTLLDIFTIHDHRAAVRR